MYKNTASKSKNRRITVTNHAVLRWLQRVNGGEQSPRSTIREVWRSGERVATDHGEGRRAGNAVVVAAGDTITTVLRGESP